MYVGIAGAASKPKSALPAPTISAPFAWSPRSTYLTSVNPSARRRSSATHCGAMQAAGYDVNRMDFVSGGGSAPAGPARYPTSAAVLTIEVARRNSRREVIMDADSIVSRRGGIPLQREDRSHGQRPLRRIQNCVNL